MEERNIRWGELISGLLIVGSAVGLVISLWSTLKVVPYFPALVFMLVTAGIFGAGLYTLRKWNLETTSRGLLAIALLLVPLNFLAAVALQRPDSDQGWLVALAVAVGLSVFTAMTVSASRVLLPATWRWLTLAVMGTSASQIVISRAVVGDTGVGRVFLLALFAVGCYLAAHVLPLWSAARHARIARPLASRSLLLLGISTFALAMPLGLLISKSPDLRSTLASLSPLVSAVAVVILGWGIQLHQRVCSRSLAALRTGGTALALCGAAVMLLALVLAWPCPTWLIAVGIVNFVALTAVAVVVPLPVLHAAAVACFTLAGVTAFHVIDGNLAPGGSGGGRRLVEVFWMGRTSVLLAALSTVVAAGAWALRRYRCTSDAFVYLSSSGGVGIVSLAIAAFVGFTGGADAGLATAVFAFYAIALLGAGMSLQRTTLVAAGSVLLLITLVHALAWNATTQQTLIRMTLQPDRPILVAFLTHAAAVGLLVLYLARVGLNRLTSLLHAQYDRRSILFTPGDTAVPDGQSASFWLSVITPLSVSALVTSVLAVPWVVWVTPGQFGLHAVYALVVALVWLTLAAVNRWPNLFAAFQTISTVTVVFGVTHLCLQGSWWDGMFLHPTFLQIQLSVLAAWCAAWSLLRRFTRHSAEAHPLAERRDLSVDQCLLGVCRRCAGGNPTSVRLHPGRAGGIRHERVVAVKCVAAGADVRPGSMDCARFGVIGAGYRTLGTRVNCGPGRAGRGSWNGIVAFGRPMALGPGRGFGPSAGCLPLSQLWRASPFA